MKLSIFYLAGTAALSAALPAPSTLLNSTLSNSTTPSNSSLLSRSVLANSTFLANATFFTNSTLLTNSTQLINSTFFTNSTSPNRTVLVALPAEVAEELEEPSADIKTTTTGSTSNTEFYCDLRAYRLHGNSSAYSQNCTFVTRVPALNGTANSTTFLDASNATEADGNSTVKFLPAIYNATAREE